MKFLTQSFCLQLLLLLTVPVSVGAQLKISGSITTESGDPAAGATLQLMEQERGVLLQETVSDSNGTYTLHTESKKQMLLSVILTGFVSQTVSINPNANAHQTLDFVLTPESRELQNVTVNSRPPLLQQQNGRLVFNVAGSATLAGSNALEAIGKTPGVLLNRQFSSITLAGKGAATVLVNDKPLQLTGADLFA